MFRSVSAVVLSLCLPGWGSPGDLIPCESRHPMNRWNIEPGAAPIGATAPSPPAIPAPSLAARFATPQEPRLNETALTAMARARQTFFAGLGRLAPHALAPARHPVYTGGPVWPALRQAWRVIHRPDTTLVCSDGLSDPFDPFDPDNPFGSAGTHAVTPGLGLEVYAEARGRFDDVANSWLFALVHQVSQNVVVHGRFASLLREHGAVSVQLAITGLPQGWLSRSGLATVLVGVPAASVPARFTTPHGPVQAVALTLVPLARRQAMEAEEGGFAGQVRRLAERLGKVPDGHVNDVAQPQWSHA